jgi:hypothetical protein
MDTKIINKFCKKSFCAFDDVKIMVIYLSKYRAIIECILIFLHYDSMAINEVFILKNITKYSAL